MPSDQPAELAAVTTEAELLQLGLKRLAYKAELSKLIGATQQWAKAAAAAVAAGHEADPDGLFSDAETDAAAEVVLRTFRQVVEQSPALLDLFAAVAGGIPG